MNPKSPCGSCCSCCCCIYITGLHCSRDSRLYNDHLHQLHSQSNLQQPKLFLLRRLFSRLNPIETSINQILTSLNDTSPIIDINAITSERGGGGGRSGWSICCCVCRRLWNSHMSIEQTGKILEIVAVFSGSVGGRGVSIVVGSVFGDADNVPCRWIIQQRGGELDCIITYWAVLAVVVVSSVPSFSYWPAMRSELNSSHRSIATDYGGSPG